jgi:hypothetical protein
MPTLVTGTIRPVPRSLGPLPGESLPGYVLRLAHRTGLSPARLCLLTSLATRGLRVALPLQRLLALPAATAEAFAAATRLTTAEASALTLAGSAGRYPPLAAHPTAPASLLNEKWIFTRFSRYCPGCLAGDGSVIQRRHGGAWQAWWRLPVMFACPTHGRLLEHLCPGCAQPAHHRGTGSPLLRLASISTLHPAACRNPIPMPGSHQLSPAQRACQQRLDQPAALCSPAPRCVLDLQTKICDLLRHDGPPTTVSAGELTSATSYLADLRVMSCLISMSWPAARDLAVHDEHADLLNAHNQQQQRRAQALRAGGQAVHPAAIHDTPPPGAATAAALLSIADTITTGDLTTVRQILRRMLNAAPAARPWLRTRLNTGHGCSPALHTAAGLETGALHVINKATGDPHHVRHRAPRPVRFSVDHVPQSPLPHWCQRYFAGFADVRPRLLHRAVAVRLAQTCTGGSVRQAGLLLGLPGAAATHSWHSVRRQLASPSRIAAFDTAIEALAEHLGTATEPVNYGRRRAALTTWSIPPPDWAGLIDGLAHQPVTRTGGNTDWGHAKQTLASVWIWVHLTHGDHIYATPIRPDPQQPAPGGYLPHYVHHRWPLMATSTRGHYPLLRQRLHTYAGQLADHIDSGQFAAAAPG